MNPLISLVIPVYNVEKYLDKCMESVLAQTYDNFEVILVDDGSTDNSGKMCDEYAEKDSRVIVYHKSNGGLSDARNFGVEKAQADLITFFDSDDYMSNDHLEYLYNLFEKYDADMSCAKSIMVKEDSEVNAKSEDIIEELVTREEMLERICYTSVSADNRLYRKTNLIANPYPVGRLYEDLATTYKIVAQCNKIACGSKVIGFWVQRNGSITNNKISEKQFDIFDSVDEVVKYYEEYYPQIVKAAYYRGMGVANGYMQRLFAYDVDNRKGLFYKARRRIKGYIWPTFFNRHATLKMRLACIVIWLGYVPSSLAWKIKLKKNNL